MVISHDGGEWDDVLCEHPLSRDYSSERCRLCAAPGRPNVSCCNGGGGRTARRCFGGYGFCNALHERLAAVCGDLVRASPRSHVYVWPSGRKACAALVGHAHDLASIDDYLSECGDDDCRRLTIFAFIVFSARTVGSDAASEDVAFFFLATSARLIAVLKETSRRKS
jgi:hypothetical protein